MIHLARRAGSPRPEPRSQKPEARSPKPEVRGLKPEARSPKPESAARSLVATLLAALAVCLPASAQPAPDSLTPDQAIAIVLGRNPGIAQATASLKASQERTSALSSANRPTLSGAGDYSHIYPNPIISFAGMGFQLYPNNNYDAHLALNWLLLDFGRRAAAVQSSRVAESTTVNQLQGLRVSLSYQVLALFDAITLEQKSIAVQDGDIADRESHVKTVERRIESGSATEYDALRSKQQLAASKNQRIDLEGMLAKSYTALRELLGYSQDQPLAIRETDLGPLPKLNADSLIQTAYRNRVDYANALAAKRSAELQVKTAKLQRLPTLSGGGTVGYKNGILPELNDFKFNWTAGAKVDIPIYTGGKTTHQIGEAEYNVHAAQSGLDAAALKIRTDVLQAKSDVESAYAKLDLSNVEVQLAEQALKQANLKYEAGVITNLDVLDAETSYAQAKLSYVQDQFRYRSSFFALGEATGVAHSAL